MASRPMKRIKREPLIDTYFPRKTPAGTRLLTSSPTRALLLDDTETRIADIRYVNGVPSTYSAKELSAVMAAIGRYEENIHELIQTLVRPVERISIPLRFASTSHVTVIDLTDACEVIYDRAFKGCGFLQSVKVCPYHIGELAFEDCVALTLVEVGNDLCWMGNSAFDGCISLCELKLPRMMVHVGTNVFTGCVALKEMVLPDCVTTIDRGMFKNNRSLTRVSGHGVTHIDDKSFEARRSLVECDFPNATIIGSSAFSHSNIGSDGRHFELNLTMLGNGAYMSTHLVWVVLTGIGCIPDDCFAFARLEYFETTATRIGKDAFFRCEKLKQFVGFNIAYIGEGAFTGCFSMLEQPEAQTIEKKAFIGCTSLLTAKPGEDTIEEFTYQNCVNITSIVWPKNPISKIEQGAFYNCTSLDVSIVRVRAEESDESDSDLESDSVEYCVRDSAFSNTGIKMLSYDFQGSEVRMLAMCNLLVRLTTGAHEIPSEVCLDCPSLEHVDMTGCKVVNSGAFMNCHALTTVIGQPIDIKENAFSNCYRLKFLDTSRTTHVGNRAFSNCFDVDGMILDKVKSIGLKAFERARSMTTVTLGFDVLIGTSAFLNCTALKKVSIGSTDRLNPCVFSGCVTMTEFSIGSVRYISDFVFENTISLPVTIDVSNNLKSISHTALVGSSCKTMTAFNEPLQAEKEAGDEEVKKQEL